MAAGMLIALGCGQYAVTTGPAASTPPATAVSIVHPERKVLKRIVEQPGTIQAKEETLLFARVPGYVSKVRPEIDIGYKIRGPMYDPLGKEIEPGEILAELNVPELEEETKQKQAMVRQTEAEVEQADKALAAAAATIAVAQAMVIESQSNFDRWESESKRMAGLTTSGVIDSQSRDETMHQSRGAGGKLATAKASVTKAKADRDRANADLQAARSRVAVAKADAGRSAAMLGYAKIRAPFDGIVTSRKVNTGYFVQPAGGAGDWLLRVAQIDPIRIVVAVPEADAELITEQSEMKLSVQAVPGLTLSGKVARTSWALDPGARTLRTELEVPNKDGLLRPGMYVYAQIVSKLPEAWTVPTSAVVKQGEGVFCFLIDGDKANRIPVQVGRSDGQSIMLLKRRASSSATGWDDFTGGEAIAVRAAGLADGQGVKVDASGK